MSRSPDYVLTAPHAVPGSHDLTLPAGAFVRPIATCYVPKHVLEDTRWQSFWLEGMLFCYTRYGILPIPKAIVRPA